MAKNYYAEDSNITLDCSISGTTMTVILADPPVYEEEASAELDGGQLVAIPPDTARFLELCQGTPVDDPQLTCGDTIIEVNPEDHAYTMGFGGLTSGWAFVFEKYAGGSWSSVGTSYSIPLPGAGIERWRIKATSGSSTVLFDPYIKGSTNCNMEEPS